MTISYFITETNALSNDNACNKSMESIEAGLRKRKSTNYESKHVCPSNVTNTYTRIIVIMFETTFVNGKCSKRRF